MSNLTRRSFLSVSAAVAGLGLAACNKNDSDKEVQTIAYFIKRNVRKADARYYSMTYQEFSTQLAVYGFYFVQNQNYAKVCKKKKTIFGTITMKMEHLLVINGQETIG